MRAMAAAISAMASAPRSGREEWPFISADSDTVLEPGMVMAFETPWYVEGLGGLIIEDQLLITATGAEIMAPLPHDLVRLG